MIWHVINAAQNCPAIAAVYVSTEDAEIAGIAKSFGAMVIDRPKELATSEATSDSVLKHAIESLDFSGNLVLMQPDSPLCTAADLTDALDRYFRCEPSLLVGLGPNGKLNGAMWIFNTADFKKHNFSWKELLTIDPYPYLMSARKSQAHIHYQADLDDAERLLNMTDEEYFKEYQDKTQLTAADERMKQGTQKLEKIYYLDLQAYLETTSKLLGPGGQLIVCVPNRFPAVPAGAEDQELWSAPDNLSYFCRSSLADLLGQVFDQVELLRPADDKNPQADLWVVYRCVNRKDDVF